MAIKKKLSAHHIVVRATQCYSIIYLMIKVNIICELLSTNPTMKPVSYSIPKAVKDTPSLYQYPQQFPLQILT